MHPTGNVAGNADSETGRINLLLERDGMEATRLWVERTLAIYRQALASPHSHASKKEYRLLVAPVFRGSPPDIITLWIESFEGQLTDSLLTETASQSNASNGRTQAVRDFLANRPLRVGRSPS